MSIPVVYSDSDKSKFYSTDDYVTMGDYHESFFNAKQTSQKRMVIAPGSVKYFNQAFTPQAVAAMQNGVRSDILPTDGYQVYASQSKLVPIVSNGSNDGYDYMSYPKLKSWNK